MRVQMVGWHASGLRSAEDRVPIGDGEAALEERADARGVQDPPGHGFPGMGRTHSDRRGPEPRRAERHVAHR